MQNVTVDPLVLRKLQRLYYSLLNKGYFFDEHNAKLYVDRLLDFIYEIPFTKHRLTKNKRWGRYYAAYKANRHTTWYITFDYEDNWYLIVNIFNNHMKAYPYFIA